MNLPPFKLERYFSRYEFAAPYLLSSSDCEPLTLEYLLSIADSGSRKLWADLTLGYTESNGHPQLREEIAQLYEKVTPDEILISVPEEGIFIALNVLLSSGDHVIVTYPGYQSLYQVAESLGCRVTHWQPEENKGWYFDPEFLESQITPQTKMIIINFPHNPTGSLPERCIFEKIISIAEKSGIYILSDEMYRGLEYSPENRLPAACDISPLAISLSGMSKVYGLAGLRLGWLATRNHKIYTRLASFKDYTTICNSAPGEILALMALRAGKTIITEQRNRISRNLNLLRAFFIRHQDLFSWNEPQAGTIGFVRLRTDLSSTEFCRKTVEKSGVLLLPSSVYDYGESHFRVGFGRENLQKCLEHFEASLNML
jgi:aspartate/methionine/tyrosine aminotransferase